MKTQKDPKKTSVGNFFLIFVLAIIILFVLFYLLSGSAFKHSSG